MREKQDATYYRPVDYCQRSNTLLKQDITLLFSGIGKVLQLRGRPLIRSTPEINPLTAKFSMNHTPEAFHFYRFYVRSSKPEIIAPLNVPSVLKQGMRII